MSWFGRWFGYGLGAAAGKALFSPDGDQRATDKGPIRPKSEEEILADEKRFDEDEKRIEAAAKAKH